MNILMTMNLPYYPAHGGANTSNRLLLEYLAGRSHKTRVVVPALGTPSHMTHSQLLEQLSREGLSVESDAQASIFTLEGVEVHAVTDHARLRAYLLAQLDKFAPDCIVVSTEDPSQNLLNAALQSDAPVVYLARTTSFLPFGPQAYFPSEQRARLLKRVDAIVAVSEFVARYIQQWSGLQAHVLPISHFGSPPFPDFGCFERGYVTMINPCAVKGISIFLGLAERFPHIEFAAVPTWGTTPTDRAALAKLPNVRLLQPTTDIDEFLSRTRILLAPSLWAEARMRIVVEAMLRGLPVLAGDVGGLSEAMQGAGFLLPVRPIESFEERLDENMLPLARVPEQDLGPWCDALRALLEDRELYEQHSRTSREAASRYISEMDISSFERLLKDVVEEKRRRPHAQEREARPGQEAQADVPKSDGGVNGMSMEQQALLMMRLRKRAKDRRS